MKHQQNDLTWFYNFYGTGLLAIISQEITERTSLIKKHEYYAEECENEDPKTRYVAVFRKMAAEVECQVKFVK